MTSDAIQARLQPIVTAVLLSLALSLWGCGAHAGEVTAGVSAPEAKNLDKEGFPKMDLEGLAFSETNHFRAYAPRGEAEAGMANILKGAEAHRTKLYEGLGLKEEAPIRVLFLEELNDYFVRRGQAPRAPDWAIGLAIPRDSTILIKWGRTSTGQWVALEPTFIHELAHMALDRAVGEFEIHVDGAEDHAEAPSEALRRIPRWLHEGYAIYHAGEWSLERGTVLMQAGLRGRIIPLGNLHRGFPASGFDVELAYAESYHFVSSLYEEHGEGALAPLIQKIGEGNDFNQAYALAYGKSFQRDEASWRQRLNVAYTWVPLITGSSTIWFLGGIVFVLAWRRRSLQQRQRLAQMDLDDTLDTALDHLPLPGMGLTAEHARPKPWRVLYDGTAVPNDQSEHTINWTGDIPADLPEDHDLPRTPEGHTIH